MNPLYNAGIALYAAGAKCAALRSDKVRKMLRGQKTTLQALREHSGGFDLWVHAASLGEFEQARPLIEKVRAEHPDISILLSFFSPSGYEVRKNYDKVDCVVYLPFDLPGRVNDFLDAAKPRMAVFVKYEFWSNILQQLRQRGVPTYLISGIFRPGQRFFRPWGGMFRDTLRCFTRMYVQDAASASLLAGIGITDAVVAGDTRFDRVSDIQHSTRRYPQLEAWKGDSQLLVAGSSWPADEERYIPYLNNHPRLKAIIAPHEFDADRLAKLRSQIHGHTVLLSEVLNADTVPADTRAIIVDSFGHLSSLYRLATVAIVGGGHGAGIHNINEAAVYGAPVLIGPRHQKFKEASDLLSLGGAFEYTTPRSLAGLLDKLLGHPEEHQKASKVAADYIASHIGATDIIYNEIFPQTPPQQ